MKTQSFTQRINRLTKLLLLAGVAAVMAVPQLEARPDHRHRGGYSRHHGHGKHDRARFRPAPPQVRRGWARPGYHGAYPPAGFVDYRYIRALPRGYRTVYRGGHRYYYANGSYYWPARYQNRGIYISVRF